MKLLRLFLLLSVVLAGCDQEGKQRQRVQDKFPNCLIHDVQIPRSGASYLVRKADGSVWVVTCGNAFNFDVSSEYMLFPPVEGR